MSMSESRKVVGAVALYPSPDALVAGLEEARKRGFSRLDVVSPYPLHGIDHLLGKGPSKLGYVALVAGLLGVTLSKVAQWWMSQVDYPLNVGGKPLFSWPAFLPVTFELMVLFASIATVISMLAIFNRLPQYGSSLLRSPLMRDLTCDKFGMVVDARDPQFTSGGIREALGGADVLGVDLLHEVRPSRFFSEQIFSVRFLLLLVVVSFVSVTATRLVWKYAGSFPPFDFMKAQEKLNPQHASTLFADGQGMRPLQAGTVARGHLPYRFADDPDGAGTQLINPIPLTAATLERGRDRYDTNCRHCHGIRGRGKGSLTSAFPKAPSLHGKKLRAWTDGRIYHVLTVGQNAMPAHARQIGREDRWQTIHYVRALQRSLNAPDADLQ